MLFSVDLVLEHLAYHPRACAFRYAEREGEGNCGPALPVAGGSGAAISAAVEKREDQRKPDAFFGYCKADRQAADYA